MKIKSKRARERDGLVGFTLEMWLKPPQKTLAETIRIKREELKACGVYFADVIPDKDVLHFNHNK